MPLRLYLLFIAPLYENTRYFAILTGSWMGLSGILQFGVVIYLTCRGSPDGPFKYLPLRVLVLITSPVLLSSVVINLYGAYIASMYKINEKMIEKIKAVILSIRVVEVMFESVPQLATQWWAVGCRINPPEEHLSDPQIVLTYLSISLSTVAIIFAEIKFISSERKANFICPDLPDIASIASIGIVLVLALLVGSIGFLTTSQCLDPTMTDFPDDLKRLYSAFISNILVLLFSFFIILLPFTHECWIISRTILYLLFATASVVTNIWMAVEELPKGDKDQVRFFMVFHSLFLDLDTEPSPFTLYFLFQRY